MFIKKTLQFTLAFSIACSGVRAFNVQQDLLRIQDALQAGDLGAASRLIDSAFKEYPHDGGLFNLRGIVHAQRNELSAARSDFEEAVKLAPALKPAWQNLARACEMGEQQNSSARECAVSSWKHVLHLDSGDAEAHRSLAKLYEEQRKFSESLREVEALHGADAEETESLLIRCADLAGLGRAEEAKALAFELAPRADFSEQSWERVRGAFDAAPSASVTVALVEGLDARNAAGLASLPSLAVAYEQVGRPADARRTLERVAALDPQSTAHLLELARLADASKDYEGALGYLAHARDLTPKNAQIHFLFAMEAEKLNLPVEARASLEKALAIDRENPAYNYAMGFVLLSTRDAATAGSYFEKFVKARPQQIKGHYALGIAYFASGDFAKSKQEMQTAEGDPKTAGGAEYFLGRIARRENDLQGSAQHLHRSIELLPEFPESRTELARVYMLQGKLKEARTELEDAVRLDPQSFQANEQLLVLYKRTRDPAAEKQAELVKKLDEDRSTRAELMLRTIEARP